MFACISLGVVNIALIPDVCKTPTPAGPVPLPYPNLAQSALHIPSQIKVMFGPGLAENIMTAGTISSGDEPGTAGGIISNVFIGPDRYLTGSLKVLIGGAFATRMTSVTGHNGMPCNTTGMSLVPGQFRVLICG
ncbi:MAG: DUF4150 domain-containing protein [Pseudomonadota bacterium]